jgi:hypothetical protein
VTAGPAGPLTPTALTPDALARLLIAAGGKAVTIHMVQAAADAGAPVGIGGRINLMKYLVQPDWQRVAGVGGRQRMTLFD